MRHLAHCVHWQPCTISNRNCSPAGNASVTDRGLSALSEAPAVVSQLQELTLEAVRCTWQGVQLLVEQCTKLQRLQVYTLQPVLH